VLTKRMISQFGLVGCLLAVLALVDIAPRVVWAQSLTLEPIASDLGRPVDITHAGDSSGRLFIVLQGGQIVIHDDGGVLETPFLDINAKVSCCRERGLLGLAFHPDYATNGLFYVNYTDTSGDTVIARYAVSSDPNSADAGSEQVLLSVPQPQSNHNGGQLRFGPDGYLYIAMGDGGGAGDPGDRAQDLSTLLGKMLRIDVDGGTPYAIPPDNPPFVGVSDPLPEIWAYGLRNPWRFSFDRLTGDLFIADVGQGDREEIDFQPAGSLGGENYGWRLMEGSECFNPSSGCNGDGSLVLPVIEYDHSGGDCSVTGGYRYGGDQLPPLAGLYLYADFCSGRIWTAEQAGAGWTSFEALDTAEQFTTFGEDQAGELYVAQLTQGGAVYRIGFTNPGDNDGDRRADLLWRNLDTGSAVVWRMEGFERKAARSIGAPDPVWQVRGLADFNADAKTDILWRNASSGNVVVWRMDGFTRTGAATIGSASLNWRIVGTGDFDGDDRDDILWRDTTNGNTVIWKMEDLDRAAVRGLGPVPEVWAVAGVGDFDADATSDILWRNTANGTVVAWKMENLARQSSAAIGGADLTWQVRGVGKFDRDGHSDILWQNTANDRTVIWQVKDFSRQSTTLIGAPSAAWRVSGLGDTDGDGQSDVIWRRTGGEIAIWRIDDLAIGDARTLDTVPPVWQVQ